MNSYESVVHIDGGCDPALVPIKTTEGALYMHSWITDPEEWEDSNCPTCLAKFRQEVQP